MPNQITIPAEYFTRKGLIVKEVNPMNAYEDNKKTDKIEAHKYIVISESAGYSTFGVKVKGERPVVTTAMLQNAEDEVIRVEPKDFKATLYEAEKGLYRFSVTASDLVIVQQSDGKAPQNLKINIK